MSRSESVRSWAVGLVLLIWVGAPAAGGTQAGPAAGPLRVHPTNPRYLTDGTGKAIYLTGSHNWGIWRDTSDYTAYLDFFKNTYGHNFVRLWAGDWSVGISPIPYPRTGPAIATDGGNQLDLDTFNDAYFTRIRNVCEAAAAREMYVGIILHQAGYSGADWAYQAFNPQNNIQGVNGDPDGDGDWFEISDGSLPAISARQDAFMRRMVDEVNPLDNIFFEIVNEGDYSTADWQYDRIRALRDYEVGKKQHLVSMSVVCNFQGQFAHDNAPLFASTAEILMPGGADYRPDPPVSPQDRISILDTDHVHPIAPGWIWKTFLRGHHPILMDWYLDGAPPGPPNWYTTGEQEAMRKHMGYTLTYAQRINLAAMTPQNSLASTSYCLADAGTELLVYQPGSGAFSVTLGAGTYSVEWFDPATGTSSSGGTVSVSAGTHVFTPPFAGEAVLYLKTAPQTQGQPPSVGFTNPANNATLTGTVAINARAYDPDAGTNDGDGIATVVFDLLQGATVVATHTEQIVAYDGTLDTTAYANGAYTLRATATSTAAAGGTSASTLITITLSHSGTDRPPSVSFTNPANAVLSGMIAVNALAYDPDLGSLDGDGIVNVVFELLQGANVVATHTEQIVTYDWPLDTTAYPDGTYSLRATSTSTGAAGGTSAFAQMTVTISNWGPAGVSTGRDRENGDAWINDRCAGSIAFPQTSWRTGFFGILMLVFVGRKVGKFSVRKRGAVPRP